MNILLRTRTQMLGQTWINPDPVDGSIHRHCYVRTLDLDELMPPAANSPVMLVLLLLPPRPH